MTVTLSAQNNFTPEKMWDLARIGSPSVSPDGNWLLYTSRSYDVKENKGTTKLGIHLLGDVK